MGHAVRVMHQYRAKPLDISDLPQTLLKIAEIIGKKEVLKIAQFLATLQKERVRVYFGKRAEGKNILKQVINAESYEQLRQVYEGCDLVLTRCDRWNKREQRQEVTILRALGVSATEIAERTGLHKSTVYRLMR